MLFPFLQELRREKFNDLPWDAQRIIADFCPNLPTLQKIKWAILHTHFAKRYCASCGKNLPHWNKKYYCMCRKKYYANRYHSPLRPLKFYKRPYWVFQKSHVSLLRYTDIDYTEAPLFTEAVVGSNQQPFVFTFHRLLKKTNLQMLLLYVRYQQNPSKIASLCIKKEINTNTCLRSYMDCFSSRKNESTSLIVQCRREFGRTYTQNKRVRVIDYYDFLSRKGPIVGFPLME